MPAETLTGESERAKQAFIVGWPVANLGGVNEVVRNLVREFASSGRLAPIVIEVLEGSAEPAGIPEIPCLRLPLPTPYHPLRPLRAFLSFCFRAPALFWRLHAICKEHRIKILNPHFVGLECFILMLFRRTGFFRGKLFLSFHGSDIRSMIQSKGLERIWSRLLLRGADLLIPCSEGLGEEILMLVPECAGKIAPVRNGIDVDRFLASADSCFELPDSFRDRIQILSVGAFEYKKAHDVLLKAFAQVRQSREDICLVIVGQPNKEFSATQQLVSTLGLEQDILLLRNIPHNGVAALLRSSDLFVLSSRWEKGVCGEGFAMALLEAAATQIPVVSTRSCGVDELIENGESGLVVPLERPDLLAQAIQTFLADPQEAARQGKNLHYFVRKHFTWAAAHARYLEFAAERSGKK